MIVRPIVLKLGEQELLQPADRIADGNSFAFLQNTHGSSTAIGDVMYMNGGVTVNKAQANFGNSLSAFWFALEVVANNSSGWFQCAGIVEGYSGLTIGGRYFLSAVTAGAITLTPTTTATEYVVPVGIAISATKLFIRMQLPIQLN